MPFQSHHKKESVSVVLERELEVLLRVAKRLTLNESDAEDLVSQTLIIAFQKWDSFDGSHARSWLIQILRNEWLQLLRKRNVRKEIAYEEVNEPSIEGFWKAVDSQIEAKRIVEALDELGEDYRVAISLCDVEELSYEVAAKVLEIPLGTLQSRLFRGRKQLRAVLVNMS